MKLIKDILISLLFTFWILATFLLTLHLRAYAGEIDSQGVYKEVFEDATEEDFEALTEVIYWESARAGCSYEVNKAVCETVLNRCLKSGKSIYAVCHQKGQFLRKPLPDHIDGWTEECMSDAISECVNGAELVLPSTEYTLFATKKQSIGTDHVWVGEYSSGKPRKGKGMYFAIEKE